VEVSWRADCLSSVADMFFLTRVVWLLVEWRVCLSGGVVDIWLRCDVVALDAGGREYLEAAKRYVLYKPHCLHETTMLYIISEGASLPIRSLRSVLVWSSPKKSYEPQHASPTICRQLCTN
jgi:hypothetical protein